MKKYFYLVKLAVIFGLITVVGYNFTDIIHYVKYNLFYNIIEMLAYNSLLILIIGACSFLGLILIIKVMTLLYSNFSKLVFYLILAASYIYTLYFTVVDFSFTKHDLTKIFLVSLYYLIALTVLVLCTKFWGKIIRFADGFIKFGFKFSCIILLILYLVFGVWSICNKLTNKTKPNVIILMADTLRSDHLGCYGYKKITPNIDNFAKDANLYKRAIAQASITHLSVPSILSGKYPLSKDSDDRVMLHEVFKSRGYSTASIISNTACMGFKDYNRSMDLYDTQMCSYDISSPGIYKKSINWIEKNKTKPFFLFAHFMDPHSPYI